jgi:hypothetical protein
VFYLGFYWFKRLLLRKALVTEDRLALDGEVLAENEMIYLRNVKAGSKLYLQREDIAR